MLVCHHLLEVEVGDCAGLGLILVELLAWSVQVAVGVIMSGSAVIVDHEAVDLSVQGLQPVYLALYHVTQVLPLWLVLLLALHLGSWCLVLGIGGQIHRLELIKLVLVLDGDGRATFGVVPLQLGIGQDVGRLDVRVGLVARAQYALIEVSFLLIDLLILDIVCGVVIEESTV